MLNLLLITLGNLEEPRSHKKNTEGHIKLDSMHAKLLVFVFLKE